MSAAKIHEAERVVKQLQYESSKRERIMVSQACTELLDFCNTQSMSDYLIYKAPKTPNAWKPKNDGCNLI